MTKPSEAAIQSNHQIFNSGFETSDGEVLDYTGMQTRADKLREWYRKGQDLFRSHGPQARLEILNDVLQDAESYEREGFLMGWNSDAYAIEHGMPLSVSGGTRQELDDVHFAWEA